MNTSLKTSLKQYSTSADAAQNLILELQSVHKLETGSVILGMLTASVGALYHACDCEERANEYLKNIKLNAIKMVKEFREHQKKGTTK